MTAVCAFAPVVQAGPRGEVTAGSATPLGRGAGPYAGGGVAAGYELDFPIGTALVFARYQHFPFTGEGPLSSAQGEGQVVFAFELHATDRLRAGPLFGFGLWPGCVYGDWCGGVGPVAGVRLNFALLSAASFSLEAIAETSFQFGMVNGVGAMFLPSLGLAVRFGAPSVAPVEPAPVPDWG